MTRIGNATLTVPLGTDSIPLERANDTTARRMQVVEIEQPAYYVEAHGISPSNTAAVNTAAFSTLVDDMGSGGIIQFGSGTYLGNFNLSNLSGSGNSWVLQGTGMSTTVLKAVSGIVLDLCGSAYVTLRNLHIYADTGADIGLLMGRYAADAGGGSHNSIENIRVTSYAAIAGIWVVGAEVNHFTGVHAWGYTHAPCFSISRYPKYGDSNTTYTSPNGTLSAPTQSGVWLRECSFVKDSAAGTGHVFEIGPEVSNFYVNDVYFNGARDEPIIVFDPHGYTASNVGIHLFRPYFEGSVTAGHGVTAIKGVRSGGTGSLLTYDLIVKEPLFGQQRMATGYYDIDLSATGFDLFYPHIGPGRSTNGGGYKFGNVYAGDIETQCLFELIPVAITATDTTFTSNGSSAIQIDDYIVVGRARLVDAVTTYSQPERKKVTNVVGTTVTVDSAFAYDHPAYDYVSIGLPQLAQGMNIKFVTSGMPQFSSELGCSITINDYYFNSREYFGPSTTSPNIKFSRTPVMRKFTNEPGSPEVGMLAYADGTGWNPGSTGEGLYVYTSGGWVKL